MDRKLVTKAIGAQLRAERAAIEMTQGRLAAIIGINIATVGRYESGGREIPAVTLLEMLDALDVPSPRFFRSVEERIQDLSGR